MKPLLIATSNAGKLAEFQHIFAASDWEIIGQDTLSISSAEETGLSFIENAIIKARWAARHCNHPCLADDSGLCIPGLDNRPGIYSSRYAGADTPFEEKMIRLIKEIEEHKLHQPSAFFYCALAMVQNAEDPCPIIATGCWQGHIQHHASGAHGFGYDPIFYVPTHHKRLLNSIAP